MEPNLELLLNYFALKFKFCYITLLKEVKARQNVTNMSKFVECLPTCEIMSEFWTHF